MVVVRTVAENRLTDAEGVLLAYLVQRRPDAADAPRVSMDVGWRRGKSKIVAW